jgi:DNA-binding NtrC family response regulator
MKILVAEDDEAIRTMLGNWLTTLGHEPLLAKDGLEGIVAFNEQKPDMVITDFWMPKVNGGTLTFHIKFQDQDTPVVVYTGFSERFTRAEAERIGANAYLQKPVDLQELQQIIELYREALCPTPTL